MLPYLKLLVMNKNVLQALGIALLGISIYFYGYFHGKYVVQTEFDTFKQEIIVQNKVAEEKTQLEIKRQEGITRDVTDEHKKELAALRNYYKSHPHVEWMSNVPPECVMPRIPETSERVNGKAKGNETSNTGSAGAIQVNPEDAAEDVLKLLKLQEWLGRQ